MTLMDKANAKESAIETDPTSPLDIPVDPSSQFLDIPADLTSPLLEISVDCHCSPLLDKPVDPR